MWSRATTYYDEIGLCKSVQRFVQGVYERNIFS